MSDENTYDSNGNSTISSLGTEGSSGTGMGSNGNETGGYRPVPPYAQGYAGQEGNGNDLQHTTTLLGKYMGYKVGLNYGLDKLPLSEGVLDRKFREPSKPDHLVLSNGNIEHYDAEGNLKETFPYTSGKDGVTDPTVPFKGPINSGGYSIDPYKIEKTGLLMGLRGDWGTYYAPLKPDPSTDTHGRTGFYIHGGVRPGSNGCVDVGSKDVELLPNLKKDNMLPIPVTVK